jgi:SHS2 domain-containing protein
MSFKEIKHTADWSLQVWGKDLLSLFKDAATGMYSLMGIHPNQSNRKKTSFTLQEDDIESLLVAYLSELLYLLESKNVVFDEINLVISSNELTAQLEGCEIQSIEKIIKAVTFHNMAIKMIQDQYMVEIVFDV